MGVAIPQVLTEDKVSGAQIVDGSLRFDRSKTHILKNTFSSAGNRKTWTLSFWHKITDTSNPYNIFTASRTSSTRPTFEVAFNYGSSGNLVLSQYNGSGYDIGVKVDGLYRDVGAWYHFVVVVDTTQSTDSNRVKAYVNGVQRTVTATAGGSVWPSLNADLEIGNNVLHNISANAFGDGNPMNGYISNFYYINGQALGPEYFGYTDPLTNTWRPKNLNVSGIFNQYYSHFTASGSDNGVVAGGTSRSSLFDGSDSSYVSISQSASTYAIACDNQSVECSTTFSVRTFYGLSTPTIRVTNTSDVATVFQVTSGSSLSWYDFSYTGTIKKIEIGYLGGSGSSTQFAGFKVDGNYLIDGKLNSFHLPFDGSAPIGQDQSGRGNHWTPVNFGGSNTLEKATGALPILNTDGGGKVARVGVRTDSNASNLVLALPLVGIKSDFSNKVNGGTTEKAITVSGSTATSAQSNFYGGSFDFSGTASAKYLSFSPGNDLAFGTGDFTIEAWVYMISRTTSSNQYVFDTTGGTRLAFLQGASNGYEKVAFYIDATGIVTPTTVIQYGTWQHWAVSRQSGTLRLFVDGVLHNSASNSDNITAQTTAYIGNYAGAPAGGYNTNGYIQDLRIYKGTAKYTSNFIPASTDPDILPDTPSGVSYSSNLTQITDGAVAFNGTNAYLQVSPGTDLTFGTNPFTIEMFVYKGPSTSTILLYDHRNTTGAQGLHPTLYYSSGTLYYYVNGSNILSTTNYKTNTWQHYALVRSTVTNTIKLYIDGVEVSSASDTNNYVAPQSGAPYIGQNPGGSFYFDGFISNLHAVNGTALYTSNFTPPTGPLTSVENTKLLCCKSNSSATAADVTPGTITANGNAAATNFNPFTANINAVRGQESGYATLNPLKLGGSVTLSNGNLLSTGSASSWNSQFGNIFVSSGKWYAEVDVVKADASTYRVGVGIAKETSSATTYVGGESSSYSYFDTATKWNNASSSSYGSGYSTGAVIGIALDLDAGTLVFYLNGVSQGTAYSSLSGPFTFAVTQYASTSASQINFGQKPFKFPPPASFQPLALANTPRPTIVRPDQYVGVATYTGSSGNVVVNLNFKPDAVWIKQRNASGFTDDHVLIDSVRGRAKSLYPSGTYSENTSDADKDLISFDINGFTLGPTQQSAVNRGSSGNYVAWAWKAGGNSNTFNIDDVGYDTAEAAGLTAGTITPTGASVGTKQGFSIISFDSGAAGNKTISHGLSQTPNFIISKSRDGSTFNWSINHKSIATTVNKYLTFTTSGILDNGGAVWGANLSDTNSTTFGISSANAVEANDACIAYLWHDVPGLQKFGSYTGNGSAEGPFVELGFRPTVIIIKDATQGGLGQDWVIIDIKRDKYNVVQSKLYANLSDAEATNTNNAIDTLSNGFKMRSTNSATNASGDTYIYAAFAEAPTFNLYGGQANAR